jgi:hypothetical protein
LPARGPTLAALDDHQPQCLDGQPQVPVGICLVPLPSEKHQRGVGGLNVWAWALESRAR